MKKIISLLLLTSIILTGCTTSKNTDLLDKVKYKNKITVGIKNDSKPFGFLNENNEPTGFDIDVAKGIAKEMLGSSSFVEFKKVTPSNRIFMLSSGKVDMVIATMTVTPKRLQVVNFSSPYYITGQAVMVKKGSKIFSAKDLNRRRVAIILGTTAETNLRFMASEAKIVGYKSYTQAYQALKEEKVDAFVADDSILYGFLYNDDSLKILPERYTKEPYAIAFRKDEKSHKFEMQVEEILTNMKKRGEIDAIRRKWINQK